ncbi:MAG: fimbrillin family protein [Prevotella sp.]|nr:fimbrillin family protein [Prevotella sp.]
MKKIVSFVLAAVALVFTACSSDETIETSGNGQNNKGMVLVATVSQQDSRAAIDVNDPSGTWNFTFDDNDNVVVGNNTINDYYTFTKSGDTFSSADAKVTSSAADWYAYYPGTTIDLTNQQGTTESAAKLYALAGKTAEATTGTNPLQISMDAKVAVLRIVKVDNYGPCDIYLKTKDGKFVSGLTAKKNDAGFDVMKSDTKVSVLYKAKEGNAGIYYVIVPAGVKISVWNNDRCFKTTKDAGLTAGKYYTLTSGPTFGTATTTAKLADGTTKTVNWVQLWIGGPRIATENVEGKMNWTEAAKTGSDYVWGANWRTPTKEEMDFVDKDGQTHNKENVDVENTTQDNVSGYLYKGVQPGYTQDKNNMFLPATDKDGGAVYWSQTLENDKGVILNMHPGEKSPYHYFWTGEKYHEYAVRPILSKETVLWGEENIK